MAVSHGLNDFYQIKDWDVGAHNEAHQRDLAWLNAQVGALERMDVKIIILSHWSSYHRLPSCRPETFSKPYPFGIFDGPIQSVLLQG